MKVARAFEDMDVVEVIWEKAKAYIAASGEVPEVSFKTWIKPAKPISFNGDILILSLPDTFSVEWVSKRYKHIIEDAVGAVLKRRVRVEFIEERKPKEAASPSIVHPPRRRRTLPNLNPSYTFETFVIGPSNRFAAASALAVAESPGKAYNPLFIYGGVGLGKTHLLQAIAHYVLASYPEMRVLYLSAETFTNELIMAIQYDRTAEFRNKYRGVDVLLIDDIQFIAGRESTQEEFFHTFNALYNAGKQIVLASDRPPSEIHRLEARLKSRFEWGLIADIQPPDFETRAAIVRKKAEILGIDLSEKAVLIIADAVKTNIREIEGTLVRIKAFSELSGEPVTVDLVRKALSKGPARKVSPEEIISAVCDRFGVSREEILSKRRHKSIVLPRQVAMYLVRELTDLSLPKIGAMFGGKDHTTVLHAYEKIKKAKLEDPNLARTIEDIRNSILS